MEAHSLTRDSCSVVRNQGLGGGDLGGTPYVLYMCTDMTTQLVISCVVCVRRMPGNGAASNLEAAQAGRTVGLVLTVLESYGLPVRIPAGQRSRLLRACPSPSAPPLSWAKADLVRPS